MTKLSKNLQVLSDFAGDNGYYTKITQEMIDLIKLGELVRNMSQDSKLIHSWSGTWIVVDSSKFDPEEYWHGSTPEEVLVRVQKDENS